MFNECFLLRWPDAPRAEHMTPLPKIQVYFSFLCGGGSRAGGRRALTASQSLRSSKSLTSCASFLQVPPPSPHPPVCFRARSAAAQPRPSNPTCTGRDASPPALHAAAVRTRIAHDGVGGTRAGRRGRPRRRQRAGWRRG